MIGRNFKMVFLIFILCVCISVHTVTGSDEYTVDIVEGQKVLLSRVNGRLIVSLCNEQSFQCSENMIPSTPFPLKTDTYLNKIKKLFVSGLVWPLSPKFHNLARVVFSDATPAGRWGDCTYLRELILSRCNLSRTTTDWLSECKNLRNLRVIEIDALQLHYTLQTAAYIDHLTIDSLFGVHQVIQAYLFSKSSHKFLTNIELNLPFSTGLNASLPEDVNWMEISAALTRQLSLLPALDQLKIKTLYKFDFCTSSLKTPVTFQSLTTLTFYDSEKDNIRFLEKCFMPNLETLEFINHDLNLNHLSYIDIEFSYLLRILKSRTKNVRRNLIVYTSGYSGNVKLNREDYFHLFDMHNSHKGEKIKLATIADKKKRFLHECDADNIWLVKALREELFFTKNVDLECRNGTRIIDLMYEHIECIRVPCNSPCLCCWVGPKDEFFADCRGAGLSALPVELLRLQNLTELLAPNNYISELPEMMPDSLKLVDLSGNRIQHLNASAALFADKKRRWRLLGNPLICDCDNEPFLDLVQNRTQQIDNYDSISCIIFDQNINITALPDICASHKFEIIKENEKKIKENEALLTNERKKLINYAIPAGSVLAVVIIVLGIVLYYRKTLKIILVARGFCPCLMIKEEADEDRRYDIFLSFCHEDTELVLGQLLPKLEEEYTVCVHLRDWIPGAMIPENIRKSVKESKRTMVMLSKKFIKSLWGNMEFETAYAASLDERRARILMVVMDDVLESEELSDDMRLYVRFNTYVRWDDPWFWSKLRYALPQTRLQEATQQQQPEGIPASIPALVPALCDVVVVAEDPIIEEVPSTNLESPIEIEITEGNNSGSEIQAS